MLLIAITWTPRSWGIFCGRMPWSMVGLNQCHGWVESTITYGNLDVGCSQHCHSGGTADAEEFTSSDAWGKFIPETLKNCTCTCVLGTTRVAYKCLYYVFFGNSFIQEITRVCAFRFWLVSRVAKQWIAIQKNWHLLHKNLCRALVAKVKLDNAKFENFHGRVNFTRVKLLPQPRCLKWDT